MFGGVVVFEVVDVDVGECLVFVWFDEVCFGDDLWIIVVKDFFVCFDVIEVKGCYVLFVLEVILFCGVVKMNVLLGFWVCFRVYYDNCKF